MVAAHAFESREMTGRSRDAAPMIGLGTACSPVANAIASTGACVRHRRSLLGPRPVRIEPIHHPPVQLDREVPSLGDLSQERAIVDRAFADFGLRNPGLL